MFGKKKIKKEVSLDFTSDDYKMKDIFDSANLFVANLEYISDEVTPYGPMVQRTAQKYLFESINVDGKIRYREIFTGFIADSKICFVISFKWSKYEKSKRINKII